MQREYIYEKFLNSSGICIDSRNVRKGSIYFALKGENHDGNRFIKEALEKGAACAVGDDTGYCTDERCIVCKDALESLQSLAQFHRKTLDIPVLAITGSNGKTTSKELIYRVLSNKYACFATAGNLNNHIGLPLSLLQIKNEHEFAVLEIGANHKGENKALTEICLPDYGITTNIGKDHMGEFGGMEGIIEAYQEFTDYFNDRGILFFLNLDDPYLKKIVHFKTCCAYGQNKSWAKNQNVRGFVQNSGLHLACSIEFRNDRIKEEIHIQSRLFGAMNLSNILAAACIGHYFGVDKEQIKQSIEAYIPENNRSQVLRWNNNTLILDAYNANPSSVKLAIENFSHTDVKNKYLILGDMYELGSFSDEEHFCIVELIRQHHFDEVILVGDKYGKHRKSSNAIHLKDREELRDFLRKKKPENVHILIKASRAMALEKAFT